MPSSFLNFVSNVERLGGKKRGRKPIFNAHMFFPVQLENELIKITREEFKRAFEENVALALQGFYDDVDDLTNAAGDLDPDFIKKVSSLAEAVGVKAGQNFSKYSEMLVGQPYFPPAAKSDIFNAWKSNFQQLCKSAEEDTKTNISRIVTQAKMNGWNKNQLEKAIRAELPEKTKKRAELIARTEMGKLNSAANLATYKEVGIEYYVWMTTLDGRERESHKAMNGRICSVDDPTVYFEETEHGLEKHMRSEVGGYDEGHPGDDFQCRCSMVAWSQALDGKYEVKEEPAKEEPEQQKEPSASEKLAEANKTIAQQNERLSALESATISSELEEAKHYLGFGDNPTLKKAASEVQKKDYSPSFFEKVKRFMQSIVAVKTEEEMMTALNYTRLEKKENYIQACSKVNPLKNGENCSLCAAALELRCRGWNVVAVELNSDNYSLSPNPWKVYKDAKIIKFSNLKELEEIIMEYEDGARFTVGAKFIINGDEALHIFSAVKENKRIRFLDPQNNNVEFYKFLRSHPIQGDDNDLFRVDDLRLNYNEVRKAVK